MITGADIATALDGLIKTASPYDPDARLANEPTTVGCLVKMPLAGDRQRRHAPRIYPTYLGSEARCRRGGLPIRPADLSDGKLMAPAPAMPPDAWDGFALFVQCVHEWLKSRGVNIDLSESLKIAPIHKYAMFKPLEKEVKKVTGATMEEVWGSWCFDGFVTDDYMTCISLSLWEIEGVEDGFPALQALEIAIDGDSHAGPECPEVIGELCEASDLDGVQIWEAFRRLAERKKLEGLGEVWTTAIAAGRKWGYSMYCYDPGECVMEFSSGVELGNALELWRGASEMINSTRPLIKRCWDDCEKLWGEFIEVIHGKIKEDPKLGRVRVRT